MANSVVTIVLACRGAGDDYQEAEANARRRLVAGANAVNADARPKDPGTQVFEVDPGDGPCAAKLTVDILTSSAGLPEATNGDDG